MTDQEIEDELANMLKQASREAQKWRSQSSDWEAQCTAHREELSELRASAALAVSRFHRSEALRRAATDYTMDVLEALELARVALSETAQHVTSYDWNADPLSLTLKQGDAFAAIARVSSNSAETGTSQIEETQVAVAPLGLCPRCGRVLNNLSPGISVVSGGISICTPCLAPGETELLRARSLSLRGEGAGDG